jgi:hypothetical protein
MKKIEEFDKETANAVGDEIDAAIKAIAEKHGLTLWSVGGTYGDSTFKGRYEVRVADADAITFKKYAARYGLNPEALGQTFEFDGKVTVTGLRVGRGSAKITFTTEDGSKRIAPVNEFWVDILAGRDPEARFNDREQAALLLKKGDHAITSNLSPKYLNGLEVEVVTVDKKDKKATVKLGGWVSSQVKKRFRDDEEFILPLWSLERVHVPPTVSQGESRIGGRPSTWGEPLEPNDNDPLLDVLLEDHA